jgi:rhodanese-related sulfurtransferase
MILSGFNKQAMKIKTPPLLLLSSYLILIATSSCTNKNAPVNEELSEFELLLSAIEKNGDFINSQNVPAYVYAVELYENLDRNFLLLDLRPAVDYTKGHIRGALNILPSELISFLKGTDPFQYEKIVLICANGQIAGYATSVLRILGYSNVYDLNWGMSSWSKKIAETEWLKALSNKYAGKLISEPAPKNAPLDFPDIHSTEKSGQKILKARAKEILSLNPNNIFISADQVFENPEEFYIINYWPEDKYNQGHIPTAIRYEQRESLGRKTHLNTLRPDKAIVVYCYTGQHAAHVVAYLRILNYDAYVLKYGAHGFMHDAMKDANGYWHQRLKEEYLFDYPLNTDPPERIEKPEVVSKNNKTKGAC